MMIESSTLPSNRIFRFESTFCKNKSKILLIKFLSKLRYIFVFYLALIFISACASTGNNLIESEIKHLNKMANEHYRKGYYADAIEPQAQLLEIHQNKLGFAHPDTATHHNRLGLLYLRIGEFDKAEWHIKKSLEIRKQVLGKGSTAAAYSYHNLGRIYEFSGDLDKAEQFYQESLEIREKKPGPQAVSLATSLADIGLVHKKKNDFIRAESYMKQAKAILDKTHGYSYLVQTNDLNLASLYLSIDKPENAFEILKKYNAPQGNAAYFLAKKNFKKAEDQFQKSLILNERKGIKKAISIDHIGLGLAYEGLEDFSKAEIHFKAAIDIFEQQWKTLAFERKKNFLKGDIGLGFKRMDAYDGIIRLLFKGKKEGYEKESFSYVESVKSRTLLEMLSGKKPQNFSKEDAFILSQDQSYQRRIALLHAKSGSQKALHKAVEEYEQFINEVKLKKIQLASLIAVDASSIEMVQSLIDKSTTVLEYFISKKRIYVWVITRNDVIADEVKCSEKKLVYSLNDLLSPIIFSRSRAMNITLWKTGNETGPIKAIEGDSASDQIHYLSKSKELYNILIQPVEKYLNTKRLIIVPYGVLHKLPFSALHSGKAFTVDNYDVCIIPSFSTIKFISKNNTASDKNLIAFANPATKYTPLYYAEVEVNRLSKLFEDKKIYFHADATETKLKNNPHNFSVLHFACHGVFNERYPMQSALLLAEDTENDGNLQVHEIFGLNLNGSDLVVLSACDTALSKIYGGDDLVGLSRGFLYAGSRSILSTLWKVDDKCTEILINEFYRNWQLKKMNKAEALRRAQNYIKSIQDYSHPFFWASFILIGDWQ